MSPALVLLGEWKIGTKDASVGRHNTRIGLIEQKDARRRTVFSTNYFGGQVDKRMREWYSLMYKYSYSYEYDVFLS